MLTLLNIAQNKHVKLLLVDGKKYMMYDDNNIYNNKVIIVAK